LNIVDKINNIIENETYEGFISIYDRFLNGDCESLSILLNESYPNGKILKIRQINEEETYNHYIYKLNNLFYDINGESSSIIELMGKIDFFDIERDYSLT